MMPERTFDADAIRAIFRHDSMGGIYAPGKMRIGDIVSNAANYAFVGKHGAVICVGLAGGQPVYNLCVGYLPEGRGAWGVTFLRACLQEMFKNGAERVIGIIPSDRPASVGLARAIQMGAAIRRNPQFAVCIFAQNSKNRRLSGPAMAGDG